VNDLFKVLITVAPGAREGFDSIAEQLRKVGLRVETTIRPIGVIVGTGRREEIPRFRSIAGVASVETDKPARIAI
jgi:hypothetical protein